MLIIMELMSEGTLDQFVQRQKKEDKFDMRTMLNLAKDITMGLIELHQQGIIHRDIKPANILLWIDNNELHAKLSGIY